MVRVWDYFGNYNDCMVAVQVEDKLKPTCVAPAPRTIGCNTLKINDLNAFGTPDFWDNCSIRDTVYTDQKNINNCGVGSIFRKWVITDGVGLKDSCTQTITVIGKSDFTVDFPDDIVANCFAAVISPAQAKNNMLSNSPSQDGHIINDGCGVLAVEIKDDTLTSVPDACYKILRQIKVIDWCKFNPNNVQVNPENACYGEPVCGDVHSNAAWETQNLATWQNLTHCLSPRERRFRDADGLANTFSDGIICFTQIIKIIDNTPPQYLRVLSDTIVKSGANTCSDFINLSVAAQDVCNGTRLGEEGLYYTWRAVDRSKTDSLVAQGTGNSLRILLNFNQEATVTWTVFDRCGNFSQFSHKVKLIDGKAPSVSCLNKNAELAGLGGNASVTLPVSATILAVNDNCTAESYLTSQLTIVKSSDNAGNTYPSVSNKSVTFTCADAGKIVPVQIWTRDAAGNATFCTAQITVQDNAGACGANQSATVSGTIQTENNKNVAGVAVTAFFSGANITTQNSATTGTFSLNGLTQGQSYQIKPIRDDKAAAGVTTSDIGLVAQHILEIAPLTSPYQIIAADVDRDGDLSTADLFQMRRVALRLRTNFPNNTSWRFVDKNYVFQNPTFPLAEDFPEVINIANMGASAQANFVGIKVGDVNSSVNPSSLTSNGDGVLQTRTNNGLTINVLDRELLKDFDYTIDFTVEKMAVRGFQFTLNTEGVEVKKIERGTLDNLTDKNFGLFDNALTTSWDGNVGHQNTVIFSLKIKAKQNGRLSQFLSLGSNLTPAESYDQNWQRQRIELRFSDESGAVETPFVLYQNEPNPFREATKIGFHLPTKTNGKMTVFDATGRTVKGIERAFDKGYNEVILDKSDLGAAGIYYYRLETPTHFATKKMLLID
ncbi:MAG: T9SS type A sorting domain-containing protein [Saprospiraceae bacterium]|nr:T9SS type A sorting domain-containing protein [Saprospiraceae bacterium]